MLMLKKISSFLSKLDITNSLFLILSPISAIIGTVWFLSTYEGALWPFFLLFFIFWALTGVSITGGYHRLFSHKAYDAHPIVKIFYLLFGAATFQNSALKWCSDHRVHHVHVDSPADPYNIKRGFFFAHMGWIFLKHGDTNPNENKYAKDLLKDPLIMWQHRYYLPIAVIVSMVLPAVIGHFLGSAWGGFFIGGILRIVAVHHATFLINSLCHVVGKQTYSKDHTARDSFFMALFTYGEGYHNFHHTFPTDYRNGVKWYHFDPTKWMIKGFSLMGLAKKLKKIPRHVIRNARLDHRQQSI